MRFSIFWIRVCVFGFTSDFIFISGARQAILPLKISLIRIPASRPSLIVRIFYQAGKGLPKKETIYKDAIIRVIMQLPRGTFREIRKNQKTGDLLKELERGGFSGICSLSYRDDISTLVLKSGRCILVESDMFKGDAALEHLLHSIADEDIDAALSTLNEAQIQLSLEFNPAEQIKNTGRTIPVSQKPLHQPPVPPARQPVVNKTGPAPTTNLFPPREERSTFVTRPPEKTPRLQTGTKNPASEPLVAIRLTTAPVPEEREIPVHATEPADFESDLDMLDSMNLDRMTDKIRDDCKKMVKQFHLDHLMDRD
jgi:hypothetical protein